MKTPIEQITDSLSELRITEQLLLNNLACAQAEAQGAQIQYRHHESGRWVDTTGVVYSHVLHYRLKPVPRTAYAHDYGSELCGTLYLTRKEADFGGNGRVIKFIESIEDAI